MQPRENHSENGESGIGRGVRRIDKVGMPVHGPKFGGVKDRDESQRMRAFDGREPRLMVKGRTSDAFRQVASVFRDGTLAGISDREILERFVEDRDEAAFELLLKRHGPMVLNVCRQTLFDGHEVEDAFQATFLALVCKASSLRVEGSLGPWLYRVASRTSARARANRRRRRERERSGDALPELPTCDEPDHAEISRVVQEELTRLPERIRAPLVLCYLQGMTHEQAARQLHCPVGTVRSRLARGRESLLRRITSRGLMIPVAAVSSALESSARASIVPPHLSKSLIKVATRFASGSASIAGRVGVSASVAALLEGVLSVMRFQKLASLATAFGAVGTLAAVVASSPWHAAGQTGYGRDNPSRRSYARSVGPDGRAIGSLQQKPGPDTYTKTYYVGDLVGTPASLPQNLAAPSNKAGVVAMNRRLVDMGPLVDLITSTVARGTWRIQDGSGKDISSEYPLKGRKKGVVPLRPIGTITPFYLSTSLIIRCTQDVHEEVADLLRGAPPAPGLPDTPGVDREPKEPKVGLESQSTDPKPAPPQPMSGQGFTVPNVSNPVAATSSEAKPDAPQPFVGKAVVPPSQDNRARIQQLLDALRQEVEKLPNDQD